MKDEKKCEKKQNEKLKKEVNKEQGKKNLDQKTLDIISGGSAWEIFKR